MINLVKNPIFWAFVAAIVVIGVMVLNKPKTTEEKESKN